MLNRRSSAEKLHFDLASLADAALAEGLHVAKLNSETRLLLLPALARLGHGLAPSPPLVLHSERRLTRVDLHLVLLVLENLLLDVVDSVAVGVRVGDARGLDVLLKEDLEVRYRFLLSVLVLA